MTYADVLRVHGRPPKRRCARCPTFRVHVLLDGEEICWDCYNHAVRVSPGRVEAKTLRKSHR